jgi:hypothetical protein
MLSVVSYPVQPWRPKMGHGPEGRVAEAVGLRRRRAEGAALTGSGPEPAWNRSEAPTRVTEHATSAVRSRPKHWHGLSYFCERFAGRSRFVCFPFWVLKGVGIEIHPQSLPGPTPFHDPWRDSLSVRREMEREWCPKPESPCRRRPLMSRRLSPTIPHGFIAVVDPGYVGSVTLSRGMCMPSAGSRALRSRPDQGSTQ